MASFKFLVFVAVAVSCAMAEEDTKKVKKDVLLGNYATTFPYASYPYTTYPYTAYPYTAYPYNTYNYNYGYDDGEYYPGKYEKPTFYAAAPTYKFGEQPFGYSYSTYNYGGYPYYRTLHY